MKQVFFKCTVIINCSKVHYLYILDLHIAQLINYIGLYTILIEYYLVPIFPEVH